MNTKNPIGPMPWGDVETELIDALTQDTEVSEVWRYSELLPRGEQAVPEPPPSRRAV